MRACIENAKRKTPYKGPVLFQNSVWKHYWNPTRIERQTPVSNLLETLKTGGGNRFLPAVFGKQGRDSVGTGIFLCGRALVIGQNNLF